MIEIIAKPNTIKEKKEQKEKNIRTKKTKANVESNKEADAEANVVCKDERKERAKEKKLKKKKEIKNLNNKTIKKFSVDNDVQKKAIYKNITQNYIFYIVVLCCLYAFTKCKHNPSSFFVAIGSIVFITFYGYIMHFISHFMGTMMSDMYSTYDNTFTRNKYISWLLKKYIYFMEFHAITHHDSDINKQYKNIALEFINNLVTQGLLVIILKYILNLIDNRVILLWAFFYATAHNINYNIIKPTTHQEHHLDDQTNYGIDIWDIIIGSKYDWNTIETHNHMAINMVIITALIIYLSNKFKW
jgi:hypothetical protein